jgi:excisionase family DNA binding protein
MDKFMTVKEICALLKITRGTVIRWIRTGELQAFKLGAGRSWRIRRADFLKFTK